MLFRPREYEFLLYLDNEVAVLNNQDDFDKELLKNLGICISHCNIRENKIALYGKVPLENEENNILISKDEIIDLAMSISERKKRIEIYKNRLLRDRKSTHISREYIEYDFGGSDGYGSGDLIIHDLPSLFLLIFRYLTIENKTAYFDNVPIFKDFEELRSAILLPKTLSLYVDYECGDTSMNVKNIPDYDVFDGIKLSDIFSEKYTFVILSICDELRECGYCEQEIGNLNFEHIDKTKKLLSAAQYEETYRF